MSDMSNVIYVKRTECIVCGKTIVATLSGLAYHFDDCQKGLSDEEFKRYFADFMGEPWDRTKETK